MKIYSVIILSAFVHFTGRSVAQSNGQPQNANDIIDAITYHDSIFWEAYNVCDVEKMASMFTDDLEFYHDKGGPTFTLAKFKASIETGMCGKRDWRLKREAIAGTVRVFPLNNYGGLISGEHIFYIVENGQARLDGYGKFTQLWQFKDNEWKMSRVLSYDHGPAPYINKRKAITVSSQLLDTYAGKYKSDKGGELDIVGDCNILKLFTASGESTLYPETEAKFFMKERDLVFEFVKDKRRIKKILIYENGSVVDEALRM